MFEPQATHRPSGLSRLQRCQPLRRPSDAFIAKAVQKAVRLIVWRHGCSTVLTLFSGQRERSVRANYRTSIINKQKKECAERREGIYLRLPQPAPGRCIFTEDFTWTEEEAARYLADGTLSRDLTNVVPDHGSLLVWVFDARGCGDELPEVEFDRVPDFEKHPALCTFVTDKMDHVALIPSEFLKLVPKGPNKVKFVLNQDRLCQSSGPKKDGVAGEESVDGGKVT